MSHLLDFFACRESVDNLFGQSVAEVLVFLVGTIEVRKRPGFSPNSCILVLWGSTLAFVLKRDYRATLGLTAVSSLACAVLGSIAARSAPFAQSRKRTFAISPPLRPPPKQDFDHASVADQSRRRELRPGWEPLPPCRGPCVSLVRAPLRMEALMRSRLAWESVRDS
jgi:hypothetical protein